MWKTFLRSLASGKRRLLATSLAGVLGVSFLVAALTYGNTMRAGFTAAFHEANLGTSVVVRGASKLGSDGGGLRNEVPTALLATLEAVDGVEHAEPFERASVQILDRDGHLIGGGGPPTMGASWLGDGRLNPFRIAEGRAPQVTEAGAPVEVVIDRRAAAEAGYHLGEKVRLATPDPLQATLVGIVTFGTADSMGPVTYAGFAAPVAESLFGRPGAVDEVRIAATRTVSAEVLRDRIAPTLPPSLQAVTGVEVAAESVADIDDQFLAMFETILAIFGGIAVVVAALSIHNTFAILNAQRARQAALLRAVGASRRQVLASSLGEAAAVGAIAAGGGLGAGYALAHGLRWAMKRLAGMDLDGVATSLTASTIVTALVVGIGVTMLAAVGPAIRSSRVVPVSALRGAEAEETAPIRTRTLVGAVLGGAGAATMLLAPRWRDDAVLIAALGAAGLLLGTILVSPALAAAAARLIGAPAALTGHAGRLARENAARNRKRTAGAATSLMVGVAMVMLFATFGSSVKASASRGVERSFGGDLIVHTAEIATGLSPRAVAAVGALPEVATVVPLRMTFVRVGTATTRAVVTDVAQVHRIASIPATGDLDHPSPATITVSEYFARDHGLHVGSETTVQLADGSTHAVTVAALVTDRHLLGEVALHPGLFAARAVPAPIVDLFVELADGVDVTAGAGAVDAATAPFATPRAQSRAQYLDEIGEEIDQTLAFIYGLLGVALVIAVMSIANTLALSIFERHREIGLLRAVGQSRAEARATVRWESVIVAVLGTLTGTALGIAAAWGLMGAIEAQEDWGAFAVPGTTVGVVAGAAVIAGVLAAWRPARRAAKLDILTAISGRSGAAAVGG